MTNKPQRFQRVKKFFGVNPSVLSMLGMVVLLGLGEKMGERFLPVYLIAIGGSVYAVGFLNAMDNFLSAIYSFVGGAISDRFGYKRALIAYTCVSLVGYLIVIVFPYWQAVLLGAIFFISWTALSLPAILSLVSSTVKVEKQTMGVSLHSLVRRIPMALGPILGAFFIQAYGIREGARIAFAFAFGLGIFALFFLWKFVEDKQTVKSPTPNILTTYRNMPGALKTLLLSDIFVRFAEQIPYAFVVLWVMQVNKFPALSFSLLTLIEMVVAMLVYIPVAILNERTSSKTLVAITFGFFTVFPWILLMSKSMEMLMFAFVIRGLKEFGEPTRKALIVKLAPSGTKASMFGTYYLLRDFVVSIVSLSSAYLWSLSPSANFITAGLLGLVGTCIFIFFGKDENARVETR